MNRNQWTIALVCCAMATGFANCSQAQGPNDGPSATNSAATTAANGSSSGVAAEGVFLSTAKAPDDPCALAAVTANPTRPAWDYAASTTQCGVVEVDSGYMLLPMGAGVQQSQWVSSLRYGLTPKLDLRWGVTNHIVQSGGGSESLEGTGDQWLGGRYRFLEQSAKLPAMAVLYSVKIPTANPAKGFGSGFVDNQFVLIASRDLGKNHFDFNIVGTEVGGVQGHDGAAQFGLAYTRPVTPKLSWILESYGGPQPGTSDRFGAAFTGATYALRSSLVMDTAYSRTYTAGSPRDQFLIGMTYALRPGFAPMPGGSRLAKLLGR